MTGVQTCALPICTDMKDGYVGLPPTDGFVLEVDGGRIIVRPSGTEPKLKCYIEVVVHDSDVSQARRDANAAIAAIKVDIAQALGL